MYPRRPRALFAALALLSTVLAAAPPASRAATANAVPSAAKTITSAPKPVKSTATKSAATTKSATTAKTAKTAAKKAPVKTGYHPRNGPAPADEYFGRLGMSILGVRNKVKDLGLESDIHPDRGTAILSNALWVEDAMRDWAKKYPFDRWLPRYAYALEQMYEHIPGDGAHKRAIKQISYLTAYFPQTVYGRVGRAKLAQGVPTPDASANPEIENDLQRLALLDGKVIPTLPPAATPSPSPTPAAESSSAPAIAPAEMPPGSATPSATTTSRPF
jgi:hypothetical protein